MKNTNLRIALTVGMFLIVCLVTQCGVLPEEPPVEPVELEPVELTYVSETIYWSDTLYNEVEAKLIEQYEDTHPNVSIVHSPADAFPHEYLDDSQPPDIIADTYYTLPAIDQGLILEISDIWQAPELEDAYPANFRALGEWNGKPYYLPAFYSWTAVYYNKEIFARYNLEPPETWDEFLAISDMLLADNITPIALGTYSFDPTGAFYWLDYLNLRLNGPEFHTQFVRGQERYDDPRIRQVFETWRSLFDRRYFSENARSMRLADSLLQVYEGKAAMILCGSAEVAELPEKFRDELAFFPFPIIDPDVPVGEVGITFGYVIPAEALHPEAAMDFLRYMASVEGQTALVRQFGPNAGILPVNRQVNPENLSPTTKQGLTVVQHADHIGMPYVSSWVPGRFWGQAFNAFSKFLRNPDNYEAALTDLEQARQQAFEE